MFLEYQATKSDKLRQLLIESCLKLVFSLARRYWKDKDSSTLKSLISAGNVGLVEAVDKFDPDRGTRFASYAALWVLMHMRTELTYLHEVVSPSPKERKFRMQSASTRERNGGVILLAGAKYEPLDAVTDGPPVLPHVDIDGSTQTVREEHHSIKDAQAIFGRWFRFLTVREQFILRAYFGLINNGEGLHLRPIATYLGLSSERVRQLKAGAIIKLRRWIAYDDIKEVSDIF